MINLAQTTQYIQLCRDLKIALRPRTEGEMRCLAQRYMDGSAPKVRIMNLVTNADTAEAYLELIRIQVSLRGMGLLPSNHPAAMVNITNFQRMLLSLDDRDKVTEIVRKYDIGNLSLYGSFITIAKGVYNMVDEANRLEDVYVNSNLSRLLSLHEYIDNNFDEEIRTEVLQRVHIPYRKEVMDGNRQTVS